MSAPTPRIDSQKHFNRKGRKGTAKIRKEFLCALCGSFASFAVKCFYSERWARRRTPQRIHKLPALTPLALDFLVFLLRYLVVKLKFLFSFRFFSRPLVSLRQTVVRLLQAAGLTLIAS